MEGVGGFLLPLEPDRLLPPAVGRLLLPSWDAAPLRGAVVTVGFWPGEAPLGFRWRGPSKHSPPPGSPLSVVSSGGARPTRLVRGTVTWTSMWMFLGRGRWPVPEGVHHGLVDPTRELKLLRSPSRGTPSGSRRPREVERLGGAKEVGTGPSSLKPSRPPPKPPALRRPSLPPVPPLVPSSKACVVAW